MCDIRKRSAMHQCRVVFQGLDQVGLQCVAEQGGHRALRFQCTRLHRLFVTRIADRDIADAFA